MWNKNRIVDGANDNLSGCYMGIAVMKALQDAGITLENTEVGVILSGPRRPVCGALRHGASSTRASLTMCPPSFSLTTPFTIPSS